MKVFSFPSYLLPASLFILIGIVTSVLADPSPQLELYPTYHCVGVEISIDKARWRNAKASFKYLVNELSEWREGHVMTKSPDEARFWASAFRFSPGDRIQVQVEISATGQESMVLEGSTQLKLVPQSFPDGGQYHVSPSGNDSNTGSALAPFQTFQKAVQVLKPGDTLKVMPGVYAQPLILRKLHGSLTKPITIEGMGSEDACKIPSVPVIPSTDPVFPVITSAREVDGASEKWKSHGNDVFSINAPDLFRGKRQESYVAMDGWVMFNYSTPEEFAKNDCENQRPLLKRGGKERIPVVEQSVFDEVIGKERDARPACTYDSKSGTLLIRLARGDEPGRHRFTYATRESGVVLDSCTHVIVKNLEVTCFAKSGVLIDGGSRNCTLINNFIHHTAVGLFCVDPQTEALTVWNNHIYDQGLHQFSWRALMSKRKGGGNHGIVIHAGRGHSIMGNRVHGHFDLFCVNAPNLDDQGANRDTDLIDNYGYNAGDDHIEADNGAVNMRILGNKNFNTLECWSLAPIVRGPVYVVGNFGLARNYSIKFNNNLASMGACFVYHNTGYTVGTGTRAINMPLGKNPLPFAGKVLRNNLFISGKTYITSGRLGSSLDYNAYWIFPGGPKEESRFEWEGGGKYGSLEDFFKGTGNEKHGLIADPQVVKLLPELTSADLLRLRAEDREIEFDLRLTPGSPCVGRGVHIPGIHQDLGRGPDLGAFELQITQ
jgi:hypothetical protein